MTELERVLQDWNLVWRAERNVWAAREKGGKRRRLTLKTTDQRQAEVLLLDKVGAKVMPREERQHLEMAKAHLNLVDPEMAERKWSDLMKLWTEKPPAQSTKDRREAEMGRGVFPLIKDRLLCDRNVESIILENKNKLGVFAKNSITQMQNLAKDLGWILHPMVKPIHLKVTKAEKRERRAITADEHKLITEAEDKAAKGVWPRTASKNAKEKADYYQLLFLTGAAQSDGANLTSANVDWKKKELVFTRAKTQEECKIAISGSLETLLKSLPKKGPLFPVVSTWKDKDRAAEFGRRLKTLGLQDQGVSLHSYRYHMAEWCATVGMPMRFAQIMLGHSSKTVANAYARKCKKAAPTPEAYMKAPVADVIDGTRLVA